MKNYTVFYKGNEEYKNMAYSFKAEDDASALDFCKQKFSVSVEDMTIIENTDPNAPSENGRLVFNRGSFIR